MSAISRTETGRAALQRQRRVRGRRGQRADVRVGEVRDVDVVALLLAGAGDGDRLAVERGADEPRHHERVAHPGAVRDAVPQDRVVLAVHLPVAVHEHLGGQLGGDVDMAGAAPGPPARPRSARPRPPSPRTPTPCWPARPGPRRRGGPRPGRGRCPRRSAGRPGTGSAATWLTSAAPARWKTACAPSSRRGQRRRRRTGRRSGTRRPGLRHRPPTSTTTHVVTGLRPGGRRRASR